MEIEEAIYGVLTTDATVAALVARRVFPCQAPQSSDLPLVIYQMATQRQVRALARVINLNQYGMDLDLWAADYSTCKALYHATRNALTALERDSVPGEVTILGVFEDGGDDGSESPIHAEENGLFRCGLNLSIWYGN